MHEEAWNEPYQPQAEPGIWKFYSGSLAWSCVHPAGWVAEDLVSCARSMESRRLVTSRKTSAFAGPMVRTR